jgi:VWFA-related protein
MARTTSCLVLLPLLVLALATVSTLPGAAQELPRVRENVVVERVVIPARVVDSKGKPIQDLLAGDFRLWVDDKPVALETAEWVQDDQPYSDGLTPEEATTVGLEPGPAGRLLVFFFQADFATPRLTGFMHMKKRAIRFLDTLKPDDQVAIVSYDSHLKLRQDFTSDPTTLATVIHEAILLGEPEPLWPGLEPSLAALIDPDQARRASSPEKALLIVAQALRKLPGQRSVVFFGWGLGEKRGNRVHLGSAYQAARRELALGRVSVYAIDVTDADYHDLEVGLMQVAEDTGGFYAKTNIFPGQALDKLANVISGHYNLVFERPQGPRAEHMLRVNLSNRAGTVQVQTTYQDK